MASPTAAGVVGVAVVVQVVVPEAVGRAVHRQVVHIAVPVEIARKRQVAGQPPGTDSDSRRSAVVVDVEIPFAVEQKPPGRRRSRRRRNPTSRDAGSWSRRGLVGRAVSWLKSKCQV